MRKGINEAVGQLDWTANLGATSGNASGAQAKRDAKPDVHSDDIDIRGAEFSPCRRYRYALFRGWQPNNGYVMFVGLNPSTADETIDDPTTRRCIAFAKAWGYGALLLANLFAYRATDPEEMLSVDDPVGPDCDHFLIQSASEASLVVAAWGTHGGFRNRDHHVKRLLGDKLHFLRLTKGGQPSHPLYLPGNLKPVAWPDHA